LNTHNVTIGKLQLLSPSTFFNPRSATTPLKR